MKLDVAIIGENSQIPKNKRYIYRPKYRINGEILLGLYSLYFPDQDIFSIEALGPDEAPIQVEEKFHSIFKAKS